MTTFATHSSAIGGCDAPGLPVPQRVEAGGHPRPARPAFPSRRSGGAFLPGGAMDN